MAVTRTIPSVCAFIHAWWRARAFLDYLPAAGILPRIGVLLTAMLLNGPAMAADSCPDKDGDAEWAASCFESDKGGRRLKPQYVKHLTFDRRGHTTIVISEPRELVAVNRQGRVIVPGIRHTGDFDFPDAERGIGRFETTPTTRGSKGRTQCGYFDSRNFRIIIPAEYAQCKPFANGEAIACKDCISVCVEPEATVYPARRTRPKKAVCNAFNPHANGGESGICAIPQQSPGGKLPFSACTR